MDKPTPRINSSLREKFVGQTVRVSGKLVSVSSNLFIFHLEMLANISSKIIAFW